MTQANGYQDLTRTLLLTTGCFCLCRLPVAIVKGEEYNCGMELNGTCVTKVKWPIPERYADKRRPFTLFYMSAEEKIEKAAVLYYVGYYHCEAAAGHICDASSALNLTGVSVTTCVTGGKYTLAADGEPGVTCRVLSTRSHTNTNSQNETKIDDTDSHLTSGDIIGISFGVAVSVSVLAAAAVFLLFRHCRKPQAYFNSNVTFNTLPKQETSNKEITKSESDFLKDLLRGYVSDDADREER